MARPSTMMLLSVVAAASACGESSLSQIVVGIDSELCEPGDGSSPEYDRVDVQVEGAEPLCAVFDQDVDGCVRVSAADLPLRLPVISESGDGPLRVSVELRSGGAIVGCGAGELDFVAGATQRLYGVVPRPCDDAACEAMIFEALEGAPEDPFPDALTCEPPPPVPATPVQRIAAGDAHACLVDATGTLFCWGANDRGQLGLGDLRSRTRPTPVDVGAGRSVEHVEGGRAHTCAVIRNGPTRTVSCWGDNGDGQVGNGETSASPVTSPVTVPGTAGAREVALGPNHGCARFEDGTVSCWGSNAAGEASGSPGDGVLSPIRVERVEGATSLAAGGNNPAPSLRHSCAVGEREDRTAVWCWGSNEQGQLGTDDASAPLIFEAGAQIVQVSLGARESCASAEDEALYCWGFNAPPGTLGFPVDGVESRLAPDRVPDVSVIPPRTSLAGPRLLTLASGDSYRCFLDGDARPSCLGNNAEGRLGSNAANSATPVEVGVPAGLRFAQIVVGTSFGCALPEDGALPFCWGSNSAGQIGNGAAAGSVAPQPILACR